MLYRATLAPDTGRGYERAASPACIFKKEAFPDVIMMGWAQIEMSPSCALNVWVETTGRESLTRRLKLGQSTDGMGICNRTVIVLFISHSVTIGMIILFIFCSWLSFVDDYKLVFVVLTNSLLDRFEIIDLYISKTSQNLSACLHEFVR